MNKKNSDSFNAYNFIVRDQLEMDFKERMSPEPLDLRLANFTLINKKPEKQQPGGILNNILKILKVV